MASPLYMDGGPMNLQALIDSLQGRRRYPIDDPMAGYQPATDPDAKPPPYAPPQFMAAPRPGRTPQDMIDEAERAKSAFQPPRPSMGEQLGDIAAKTGQVGKAVATAPVNMVRNLYEKVAAQQAAERSPSPSSDVYADPRAMAKDPDVPATALGLMGAGVPFAKPGTMGISGGKLVVPAAERAAGTSTGPFYSAVEQALANAKLEKAPLDQWHNYLKGQPGVKAEELNQLGLTPGALSNQSMTKAQLQEHLDANRVQLKEVTKGGGGNNEVEALARRLADFENGNNSWDRIGGGGQEHYWRDAERQLGQRRPQNTKFQSYQLPGAANYGETLLTLPSKKPDTLPKDWTVKQEPDGGFYVYNTEGQMVAGGAYRAQAVDNALFQIGKSGPRTEGHTVNEYRSSHWDEPNVLAHVRHNDRFIPSEQGPHSRFDPATVMIEETDPPPTRQNGYNSLHLEEVQSDMHQAGRKQGYKSNLTEDERKAMRSERQQLDEKMQGMLQQGTNYRTEGRQVAATPEYAQLRARYDELGEKLNPSVEGVPDAPFKDTWSDLALKRMLHKAATETNPDGSFKYHAMSWTPGEAQAARYDLSKQLSKVSLGASNNPRLPYNLIAYDKGGSTVMTHDLKSLDELENVIGKEPAQKLINKAGADFKYGKPNVNLDTPELKIGGEGMKEFYDRMLVNKANALGKKYGAKVTQPGGAEKVHVLPITPELRVAAAKGFPLFALGAVAGPAVSQSLNDRAVKALATPPPNVSP